MKHVKNSLLGIVTVSLYLLTKTGIAQLNNHHKNYIDIGVVGGMQHTNSPLGGVYGSFGTFFMAFGRPSSIDIRARELYIANPELQGTLLTFTYRISLIKGLFLGIGGAHGHQVAMDEFLTHPGSSIGGTNANITHSTGFNSELGYNFSSFIKNKYLGIYPTVHVAYSHLLATNYSRPIFSFNAGFRVGFKQWN